MIKIAWKDNYVLELPKNHSFPMEKYELLPMQLKHEGVADVNDFFVPQALSEDEVLTTHTSEYWEKLKNLSLSPKEEKKTGFPQSQEMVEREVDICGGTYQLAKHALEHGCGFNIAGGTHHAFTDHGEGYCLLNDNAIAANLLLLEDKLDKALIVDLDVHQGNGTAEIFSDDERVFTFSMHGERNYPTQKMLSDLDIPLKCGTGDDEYLRLLKENLETLINQVKPGIIFYQAGVDVLNGDKFGRLALSMKGCMERDLIVLSACQTYSIPVVVTMGGGYSRKLSTIINAHTNTFKVAYDLF